MRISAIEIIGSKRTNRNSSVRNNPIEPTKVITSHLVGVYIPHDDGRKSRCRLVTTMMKRSSHMPTPTISDIIHKATALARNRLDHNIWGARALQAISVQ